MTPLTLVLVVIVGALAASLGLAIQVVRQFERGVSPRMGSMPAQARGITTGDGVSVDVSAVTQFRVVDRVTEVVAMANVHAVINQIAHTTLGTVAGQHTLEWTRGDTDRVNARIRSMLDTSTAGWGVEITAVELTAVQLSPRVAPDPVLSSAPPSSHPRWEVAEGDASSGPPLTVATSHSELRSSQILANREEAPLANDLSTLRQPDA